jgi:hypothetical protein
MIKLRHLIGDLIMKIKIAATIGLIFFLSMISGCQKQIDNDFIVKYKAPNSYYSSNPMWGAHYQMNTSSYPGNDFYNQNF